MRAFTPPGQIHARTQQTQTLAQTQKLTQTHKHKHKHRHRHVDTYIDTQTYKATYTWMVTGKLWVWETDGKGFSQHGVPRVAGTQGGDKNRTGKRQVTQGSKGNHKQRGRGITDMFASVLSPCPWVCGAQAQQQQKDRKRKRGQAHTNSLKTHAQLQS